ncbi:uncharacterized protein EI90DRAFT_3062973 [Cantharellus anzutake]|uniref:uncharacterized protein n=1 Tax=Cantharellus anzutake TaxID=1750568 RepID=UPI0019076A29|nr:uncharacterized protein EI90DRAFT_3062973 [Cantharellus anzutake]KAF8329551.1 hypothetical protein EI90DRAFT_3062973 [Cantharellus anzutake]
MTTGQELPLAASTYTQLQREPSYSLPQQQIAPGSDVPTEPRRRVQAIGPFSQAYPALSSPPTIEEAEGSDGEGNAQHWQQGETFRNGVATFPSSAPAARLGPAAVTTATI